MWSKILRVVCFTALIVAATVFGLSRSFADAAPFEITNVVVSQKSDTTTGGVTGFEGNRINNNVTFHKVGDSVTYRVTIKNVSASTRVIDNVASTYEGELFTYEFNSYAGDEIASGDSFDFVLKTTYKSAVSDVTKREQNLEINFVFKFSDGSEMTIVIANPSTWDNISVFGVVMASCVIVLLALIIFRMKRVESGKKVVMIAALLAVACVPLPFVNAADGVYDVTITSNFSLKDELVVKFLSEDGTDELEVDSVEYEGTISGIDAPEKTGYQFTGWKTEDGNIYDFVNPVVEDLTLYAVYTPYTYTVSFSASEATSGQMSAQQMTYDTAASLTKNAFVRAGYDFASWKDNGGNTYSDEQEVLNLMSIEGNYPLSAQWNARTDTKYCVITVKELLEGEGQYETLPEVCHTGKTDEKVTPTAVEIPNYVTPNEEEITILGDNSAKVTYTYDLVRHQLTLEDTEYIDTTATSGEYKHGATVTLRAKEINGLKFVKWSNDAEDEEISIEIVDDITIKPIYKVGFKLMYSHEGACTFNGIKSTSDAQHGMLDADFISGDDCTEYHDQKYIDTGVQLYTEENAHKDFLVEFSIDEFDLSKNGQRSTLMNSTYENDNAAYPGIVVRRNDNQDKLMIGVNVVKNNRKTVNSKTYFTPFSSVERVRIMRKDDAICYAINDEDPVYVGDNTPHNYYFESPTVMFGASIDFTEPTSPELYRYTNGTLSGMKILLGKDVDDTLDCKKPQ